MFFFKKKLPPLPYDPETQEPVVRRSICTGEMTLGFADKKDGRFHEYELAHTEAELAAFCRRAGIAREELKTVY
ncbi:MAG: aspartate dehydrogenase [bacterium]